VAKVQQQYAKISFAGSSSTDCRFIRVTQTGRNHYRHHMLDLTAVEFFLTLSR
jgi:hypothetical protein